MLILQNRLLGIPILSLQTGTELGVTDKPIIDPRNLTILAFYCAGPLIPYQPAILHVEDIREISDLGFIVDNADTLMPPDDLVRLNEVLEFNFELEGKKVIDDTGHRIGKVINYSTDLDSFYIMKLHVQPSIWQSFNIAERIIDRTQIKSITDKHIVVNRATIDANRVKAPIHNPFHKVKPQAEAIDTGDISKR